MVGTSSFFFNNFQSSQEQDLLENLIIEAVSIYGLDCYYVPRNINNLDKPGFHHLLVTAVRPGEKLNVRTRPGYMFTRRNADGTTPASPSN